MLKFEYEIKVNDKGRPYIEQSKENENLPEHKFMAVEITRYMMHQLLIDNQKEKELSDEHEQAIAETGMTLEYIADQIASMLSESMNLLNDLGLDVEDD